MAPHPLTANIVGSGVPGEPGFRADLYRARAVRGDYTFGEEILDIVDNTADDRATFPLPAFDG